MYIHIHGLHAHGMIATRPQGSVRVQVRVCQVPVHVHKWTCALAIYCVSRTAFIRMHSQITETRQRMHTNLQTQNLAHT